MKNCLDEGMLQSYLDGELSPELSARAAAHVGACDACADALGAASEELALFARSFAPDASLSVPTEALRGRLDAAIAGVESARAAHGRRVCERRRPRRPRGNLRERLLRRRREPAARGRGPKHSRGPRAAPGGPEHDGPVSCR